MVEDSPFDSEAYFRYSVSIFVGYASVKIKV